LADLLPQSQSFVADDPNSHPNDPDLMSDDVRQLLEQQAELPLPQKSSMVDLPEPPKTGFAAPSTSKKPQG